jgi:outer membrane protein TolC
MGSEGNLNKAKDEFKLLIGLDLNEEIELEAEMEFESFLIDMQKAIDEALTNRMEIQENNVNIELQEIAIKRAKRERELKGYIFAYYNFTGLSTKEKGTVGELIGSSFDNMIDRPSNRGIGFTLAYPIADWGRAKNQVKRQQVIMKQQELNLDNQKRIIESEIRDIVRTVREAEKRFRVNQKNREVATQSYQISQLKFESGDITSPELFIEQKRLLDVQLNYIDSYITYRLSMADLSRKTMYDFEHNRRYLIEN